MKLTRRRLAQALRHRICSALCNIPAAGRLPAHACHAGAHAANHMNPEPDCLPAPACPGSSSAPAGSQPHTSASAATCIRRRRVCNATSSTVRSSARAQTAPSPRPACPHAPALPPLPAVAGAGTCVDHAARAPPAAPGPRPAAASTLAQPRDAASAARRAATLAGRPRRSATCRRSIRRNAPAKAWAALIALGCLAFSAA